MEDMTKHIITARNLDASAVDEYGTDEYNLDESICNLQDIEDTYATYVKDCGDKELIADFQTEFLHWNIGKKVVFDGSKDQWDFLKEDDDWDFPQAELADILRGDLSDGVAVYVHFKDWDGEYRYGELSELELDKARKYFGEQGTPMENIA